MKLRFTCNALAIKGEAERRKTWPSNLLGEKGSGYKQAEKRVNANRSFPFPGGGIEHKLRRPLAVPALRSQALKERETE